MKWSRTKWLLEGLTLASILAMVGLTLVQWQDLPARIPMHFGISGKPDGWGGKDSIWILSLLAVVVNVILSIASVFPAMQNLPFDVDRSRPEVQRVLFEMATTVTLAVTMVLAIVNWSMIEVGIGRLPGLGCLLLPVILAMIFIPVGYYLVKLRRI